MGAVLISRTQHAFGEVLKSLNKLSLLHLGIFLSSNMLFDDHLAHAGDFRFPPSPNVKHPFGPDLCPECEVYTDDVRSQELLASAALATYLPLLESISWSTFFAQKEYGDNPRGQTTTVWIQPGDEPVAVRRAPWK